MPGNKKSRRALRRRRVLASANPIALAMRRASLIPQAEINEVMAPIEASFRAMREGVATEDQWCVLAGGVELALSIERTGVGAITGTLGHLQAAETALAEIARRARRPDGWKPTPLYWQEIEHLDTFTLLHKTQLEQLSEGEFHKAHKHAVAQVLGAGGRAVDINDLQVDQAQLPLGEPA